MFQIVPLCKNIINAPTFYRKAIKSFGDKKAAKVFDEFVLKTGKSLLKSERKNAQQNTMHFVVDITEKIKMCEDNNAVNKALNLIYDSAHKSVEEIKDACIKAQEVLDLPNIISQKYTPLYRTKHFGNLRGHFNALKPEIEHEFSEQLALREDMFNKMTTLQSKLDICEDKIVNNDVKNLLNDYGIKAPLTVLEDLLDAVNQANGKYIKIQNPQNIYPNSGYITSPLNFYKNLLKDSESINAMKMSSGEISEIISAIQANPEILYSNEKKFAHYLKTLPSVENDECMLRHYVEWFSREEGIKQFINSHPEEKNIINYLYENIYLNKFCTYTPDIKKHLLAIKHKFGTMIFGIGDERSLNYIEEELRLWKKAAQKEVKLPKIIEVGSHSNYELSSSDIKGICYTDKTKVIIDADYIKYSLRHELAHYADKTLKDSANISTKDVPSWVWEELKNMGVSEGKIEYAKNNMAELKAVFAESDMQKASGRLKKYMTDNGLPEYVINIPENTLSDPTSEILKECLNS